MAILDKIKQLRQKYLIKPLITYLQKQMPPISPTEREAIEAGDVWFEKELFCGKPDWQKLLGMPAPQLTPEEHYFIDHQVVTFCRMINDWDMVNHTHDLPQAAWDYVKKERFLGLVIPTEYGGRGFSAFAHSTVVVKIATRSVSAAVNIMVPNSLGPAELLLHYGTDEQKSYYLPRLSRGEEIPCFALTGAEAGSDAGAMTDNGVVCYGDYQDKKNILGIRLTWDKRYITLAPIATLLGLAFRLYDPDHLLGNEIDIGITLCLIPTNHPGVEVGHRHFPLHLAFMNGPTRGENVFIPMEWVIGGVARAGHGWKMLMECLAIGRSISLPALSTACTQLTYRMTGAYARLRKQFNLPIAQFEGVEESLSYIAGSSYLLEAARLLTVSAVDQHLSPAIPSAIAKYHMTELARLTVNHAMDIHGGHAIQTGPRNFLAQAYMALPIAITVEGANILTRNLIIFGQGAIRCHPYILDEVTLLSTENTRENSAKNTAELEKLLLSHIKYAFLNQCRTIAYGLTGGYFIHAPVRGVTARYYRQLTRMSTAFAFLSDLYLLILGGKLKRKERISARLGDILSQLYLGSAVLKYFHDQKQPESDVDYIHWCLQTCLAKIQIAIDALLQNFPLKIIGKILRWLIFPWGTVYRFPKDDLSHRIVRTLLENNPLRERLTHACYISPEKNDPMRQIETAFLAVRSVEPIWKKFQHGLRDGVIPAYGNVDQRLQAAIAKNVLTTREKEELHEFLVLYQDVIRVNEFSFDLSSVMD